MKLIVLEGPDGGGKTTLAGCLSQLGYQVIPMGVPPPEAQKDALKLFDFFDEPLAKAIVSKQRVVFDRLHLSDRIYGPLMRGGSLFEEEHQIVLDYLIQRNDGQVVICLPPYEYALESWKGRKELEYVKKMITFEAVYKAYANLIFYQSKNKGYMWYDYTRHDAMSFALALSVLGGKA